MTYHAMTNEDTMPFITEPELDRLMGRRAPGDGAFTALLCLGQLAPDAPAPLEVLIQALNAWWDAQRDDLMTMLEGLEERERVDMVYNRTGIAFMVKPELYPEIERQLTAMPDDEQRAALLDGVRVDIDTALTELVFDVYDPSPAPKEAWCRMFIPHLLYRMTDNLALLPTLADVVAHYEPAHFDVIVERIPDYLRSVLTFDSADAEEADHPDDAEFRQAQVAMEVEVLLQHTCLAIEGVADAGSRRRYHAAARALVTSIEDYKLERSISGRLQYASLPETSLEEAQALLHTLFDRSDDRGTARKQASYAHRVAAVWLHRLRRDAPADTMIAQLMPFVTEVRFDTSVCDENPELELGVAICYLIQAELAADAGEMERASALLLETLQVLEESAALGVYEDDDELADRLIATMQGMYARLLIHRGDIPQARTFYTTAITILRREHGRQHQLVRQLDRERRRLHVKRASLERCA